MLSSPAPEPRRPPTSPATVIGSPGTDRPANLPAAADSGADLTLEHAPSATYIVWNGEPWAVKNVLDFIGQQLTSHPTSQTVRILLPTTAQDSDRSAFMETLITREQSPRHASLHHATRRGSPAISNAEALLIDGITERAAAWGVPVKFGDVAIPRSEAQEAARRSSSEVLALLQDPKGCVQARDAKDVRELLLDAVRQNLALRAESQTADLDCLRENLRPLVANCAGDRERVFVLLPALGAGRVCPEKTADTWLASIDDLGRSTFVDTPKPQQSGLTQVVEAAISGRPVSEDMATRFLVTYLTCRTIDSALPPEGYASFQDLKNDRRATDVAACADSLLATLSGTNFSQIFETICASVYVSRGGMSVIEAAGKALEPYTHRIIGRIVPQQRGELAQAEEQRQRLHARITEALRQLTTDVGDAAAAMLAQQAMERAGRAVDEVFRARIGQPLANRHSQQRQAVLDLVHETARTWLLR